MHLLKDRLKEELERNRKEKYLAEKQELVQVGAQHGNGGQFQLKNVLTPLLLTEPFK